MSSKKSETQAQELKRLQRLQEKISRRIAKLESRLAPAAEAPADDLSDEEMAVLSAAVFVFLGSGAQIQSVKRKASLTWAQQGRALIQSLRNLRSKPKSLHQP